MSNVGGIPDTVAGFLLRSAAPPTADAAEPLPTLLSCVASSFLPWYAIYLPALGVLTAFAAPLKPFKINPNPTPRALMLKEFRRSQTSLLISALLEALVLLRSPVVLSARPCATAAELLTLAQLGRLALILIWSDAHFFCIHSAQHLSPTLYRRVHKVHHESINPNVLSGLSFHPVEGCLYFSSLLFTLLLPLTPLELRLFKIGLIVAPIGGHWGYTTSRAPSAGRIEHYVHHVKFSFNYGAGLFPDGWVWDKLFRTQWPHDREIKLVAEQAHID